MTGKANTAPLGSNSDDQVAHHAVAGRSVLEEAAVIPPALVRTVELKTVLILLHLEAQVDGVGVTKTVVPDNNILCLVLLAIDKQPTGRLRKEGAKKTTSAGISI